LYCLAAEASNWLAGTMSLRLELSPTLTPSVGPACLDELLHAPNKTIRENKKYFFKLEEMKTVI
jgi:hypothetical protein